MTDFTSSRLFGLASADLGLSHARLRRIVSSAGHRYKRFEIPKKSGGMRVIFQPDKSVKLIQRWLSANVLDRIPVHAGATAYVKGRSILDNARPHADGCFMLKLDFVDFFPSLKEGDIRRYFSAKADLSEEDIEFIVRTTCKSSADGGPRCLTIGAPSSPVMSNVLCHDLDRHLADHALTLDAKYTRYADDLTFSAKTPDPLSLIYSEVVRMLRSWESPRLTLNAKKTVFVSRKNSMRVTGVILQNDGGLGLGRNARRKMSSCIHRLATGKPLESAEAAAKVAGWIAYFEMIEPVFLEKLRAKYGASTIDGARHFHAE